MSEDARPTRYGKRKLGAKAHAEQKSRVKRSSRRGTVYGGRKGAPAGTVTSAPQVTPDKPQAPTENPFVVTTGDKTERLSIPKVEEILEAQPHLVDLAIETEVSLDDKPRKGAIKLFRDLEQSREKGPRASVMKLLAPYG